jgi:hypothetical protein
MYSKEHFFVEPQQLPTVMVNRMIVVGFFSFFVIHLQLALCVDSHGMFPLELIDIEIPSRRLKGTQDHLARYDYKLDSSHVHHVLCTNKSTHLLIYVAIH